MTARGVAMRVRSSVLFYPLTTFYCAAVLATVGVAQRWFRLDVSIVALTVFAVLLLLLNIRKQVLDVHQLVNSQRDDLVERVEQLIDALHTAGVDVPGEPHGRGTGT